MARTLWVFKLFNTIKDEHEVTFAELELRSLAGPVEKVRNFSDLIYSPPLQDFCGDECRVQDILTYEPVYGKCQGFSLLSTDEERPSANDLTRRLAYTREILIVQEGDDAEKAARRLFPSGILGRNFRAYSSKGHVLLRIITNQYFLEKSLYISKLSRHEPDVDKNTDSLFSYPFEGLYRIPASSTMAVGKRLEDYFAIREEPSLYLTHVWHPYKAKFHAKMARALLNYVCPDNDSYVMDNWAGSGTLNVEATLMGLKNVGLEINPLSALMADVKCQALSQDPKEFRNLLDSFLEELQVRISSVRAGPGTVTLLEYGGGAIATQRAQEANAIKKEAEQLTAELKGLFTPEQIQEFLVARNLINEKYGSTTRLELLLALCGSISDLARRRKGRLVEVITLRLYKLMYLRLYLFSRLNEVLGIELGKSETLICDNRDPEVGKTLEGGKRRMPLASIDGVVTSPPYSTAVDYIRNDYPQLAILRFVVSRADLETLEKGMEGNPKPRLYRDTELRREVEEGSPFFNILPEGGKVSIGKLRKAGREAEGLRSYKFFKDMYLSLIAMNKLLKVGAKAAIVIGNNHYKISEEEIEEVENDRVMLELALRKETGFVKDEFTDGLVERTLEKTQEGYIRNESVLVLVKDHDATEPVV